MRKINFVVRISSWVELSIFTVEEAPSKQADRHFCLMNWLQVWNWNISEGFVTVVFEGSCSPLTFGEICICRCTLYWALQLKLHAPYRCFLLHIAAEPFNNVLLQQFTITIVHLRTQNEDRLQYELSFLGSTPINSYLPPVTSGQCLMLKEFEQFLQMLQFLSLISFPSVSLKCSWESTDKTGTWALPICIIKDH